MRSATPIDTLVIAGKPKRAGDPNLPSESDCLEGLLPERQGLDEPLRGPVPAADDQGDVRLQREAPPGSVRDQAALTVE